ncbi:MAG: hypothetical protein AAF604_06875 [Acidobacteriota bacterium]
MVSIIRCVASHPASSPAWASPRATAVALALLLAAPFISPVQACEPTPSPPVCGKTLILAKAAREVVLLPAGGTFDIDSLVYFGIGDFPAGSGLCPPGPYTVDITYTATCTPAGDGGGSVVAATLSEGFNEITVPITLPAGPPRICTLAGTATVTLADGMILEARSGGSAVCVGDPAPGNPAVPRLDFELLDPSPISLVQPGDQGTHLYRITNNDPTETFTGILTVDLQNTSRLPAASGPMPPGTGPFSISDPGLGDNFPIGFEEHLFQGCLPQPPDPRGMVISQVDRNILLPPGASFEFDLFVRPWSMCGHGSCAEGSLIVDGAFSGLDPAVACAGLINAVDIASPPQFLWPDAGSALAFLPPLDPLQGVMTFEGVPLPGPPLALDWVMIPPQLEVGGDPLPQGTNVQLFSDTLMPGAGRNRVLIENPGGLMPIDSTLDAFFNMQFPPLQGQPQVISQVVDFTPHGGPTGFEQIAPTAGLLIGLETPSIDPFFTLSAQFSGIAIDNLGQRHDLLLPPPVGQPLGVNGLDLHLQALVQSPRRSLGGATTIMSIELYTDLRGFASPQPESGLLFRDKFEDGDTDRWSATVQ